MLNQISIGKRLTGGFLIATLITFLTGSAGLYFIRDVGTDGLFAGRQAAPLVDAVMESKLKATEAHLKFEELMGGDVAESIDNVRKLLKEARWYTEVIGSGGKNEEGEFVATSQPETQAQVKSSLARFDAFERALTTRFATLGKASDAERLAYDVEFDKSFEEFIAEVDKLESHIQNDMQAALGHLESSIAAATTILIVLVVIGLAASVALGAILMRSITRPLGQCVALAKEVEQGNLSVRISPEGSDEVAQLVTALGNMQSRLRDLIGQIAANARMTASSCGSMSAALQNITQAVHGQNDATSAVAAAVEQMSVSINNIHDNASQALGANHESAELASQGVSIIQSASDEMLKISATVKDAADVIERVGQQTDEISSIVSTIREVAEQTNLLALNAAIEAARAGEQGRGFAVVADEVRKLAEKTTSSSEEIRRMIEAVQQSSGHAVSNIHQVVSQMETTANYASNAREAIERIQRSSKQSEGYAKDISWALGEQSSASHLISEQVEGITRMSDENAQSVTSAGKSMRELENESRTLDAAVANFKL